MADDDPSEGLDEPWKRLEWLRKRKFGDRRGAKGEAADAMHMPRPTYYGHENGTTDIPRDQAIRYTSYYGVDLTWFLTGRGTPRIRASEFQRLFDRAPPEDQQLVINLLRRFGGQGRER